MNPSTLPNASVHEVIITKILRRGNGKSTPIRRVVEVFSRDGQFIADYDPDTYTIEQLEKLAIYLKSHVEDLVNDPQTALRDWIQTNP